MHLIIFYLKFRTLDLCVLLPSCARLSYLVNFSGDAVLVTKLSLAVADLALQMVSWKTIVNDLVTR